MVIKLLLLPILMLGLAFADEEEEHPADNIRSFRIARHKIPERSKCEEILVAAEQRLGRHLTRAEIEAHFVAVLEATGEVMEEAESPGPPPKPRTCYLGGTIVSTPSGPRLVGDLKVGDQVISVDEKGNPVMNQIANVFKHDGRTYSSLEKEFPPIDAITAHPISARILRFLKGRAYDCL